MFICKLLPPPTVRQIHTRKFLKVGDGSIIYNGSKNVKFINYFLITLIYFIILGHLWKGRIVDTLMVKERIS